MAQAQPKRPHTHISHPPGVYMHRLQDTEAPGQERTQLGGELTPLTSFGDHWHRGCEGRQGLCADPKVARPHASRSQGQERISFRARGGAEPRAEVGLCTPDSPDQPADSARCPRNRPPLKVPPLAPPLPLQGAAQAPPLPAI